MQNLVWLHQSLLEPILSEWMYDEELCRLDTAVCNSGLRDYFLSILSLSTAVRKKKTIENNYYDWIYKRRMSLSCICIIKSQCHRPTPAVQYAFSTSKVNFLDASACKDLVPLVQDCNWCLRKLSFRFDSKVCVILKLLQLFGNTIERLDLSNLSELPWELGRQIAQYCPNLTEIDVLGIDLLPILQSCPVENLKVFHLQSLFGADKVNEDCSADVEWTDVMNSNVLSIGSKGYRVDKLSLVQTSDTEVDFLMPYLPKLTSLTLFMSTWPLMFEVLSKCTQLESLHIVCLEIHEEEFISLFDRLTALRTLKVNFPTVTDVIVLAMAHHCPRLESLTLRVTDISSEAQRQLLEHCPLLMSLEIASVIEEDLMLSRAVDLEEAVFDHHGQEYPASIIIDHYSHWRLFFRPNQSISCECFNKYLIQSPSLTDLHILRQELLNDESVEVMVKLCPGLTSIGIVACKNVTSIGLYAVKQCKSLTDLRYKTFHDVNNLELKSLLSDSLLRCLHLDKCKDLADGSLALIAYCCPSMTELAVSHCEAISSSDVIALLQRSSRLTKLFLNGCTRVTESILSSVKNSGLRLLNVKDTQIHYDSHLREFIASLEGSLRYWFYHDGPTIESDEDKEN